jgi:TPR repeat protein
VTDVTTADQNTRVADAAALYEHGMGLYDSGDRCAGEEFWSKAADAGHSDAQYNLGVVLYECAHDDVLLARCEELWRSAASAGHVHAQYNLGVLLNQRHDEAMGPEAETWWRRAAEAGHIAAQYNLGSLLDARGDEVSIAKAETWRRAAAEAGHVEAAHNLSVAPTRRTIGAAGLPMADIEVPKSISVSG